MSINWTKLYADSVHPNAIGAGLLARYIVRALSGHACFAPFDVTYSGIKFKGVCSDKISLSASDFGAKTINAHTSSTIKAYDASDPLPICPCTDSYFVVPIPYGILTV